MCPTNILILVVLSTRRVRINRFSAAHALAPYDPAEQRPGRTRHSVYLNNRGGEGGMVEEGFGNGR